MSTFAHMRIKENTFRYWKAFYIAYFCFLIIIVYLNGNPFQEYWFPNIIYILFGLSLMLILILPFVVLIMKERKLFWRSLAATVFSVIFFLLFSFFSIYTSGMHDHFGARHPIPEGLEYSLPKEKGFPANPSDSTTWILLEDKEGQPGVYYYRLSAPQLPDGEIALESYEVTSNYKLDFYVNHKPIIYPISGHTAFGEVASSKATLYDGSWGEPYAVRIDLIFTPKGSSERRLLASKIYCLEGWSR